MSPEISARLSCLNIEVLAETKQHFVFTRDACIAVVERTNDGIGSIGSTGMMTETGLAYLVWRDEVALLVGKAGTQPADPNQLEQIRRFSEDLKSALK